jgi:hypothetical protein
MQHPAAGPGGSGRGPIRSDTGGGVPNGGYRSAGVPDLTDKEL